MNFKKFFLTVALILLTATTSFAAEENFEQLATTYSDDGNASLMLIRYDDGQIFFGAVDKLSGAIALVEYSNKLRNFYVSKNEYGYYPSLIFLMAVCGQERGQLDDDLGEWQQEVHLVPVYASFDVVNGQIVCDNPFYSATYLNPSHYHAAIQNPKHTRLIEIFVTQMPRLNELIESKGIVLP